MTTTKQPTVPELVKKVQSNLNKIARDRGKSDSGKLFTESRKLLKVIETYVTIKWLDDQADSLPIPTATKDPIKEEADSQDRGEQV